MNSASSPVANYETDVAEIPQLVSKPADIKELQARIATLEAELAQLNKAQAAIAYGISHELRAPLRAMDGFGMQLSRELEANETASQQVAKIRAAVTRMGGLTESLLEYSRMMRAELHTEAVDISFLADWALMDLRAQYLDQQVDAEIQPDLHAQGDERLLRTLLDKVFDNSRKFAQPGQPVILHVRGERVAEGMYLNVIDQGIGMAMRDAEQPFEPFMRLHCSREGAGDGLGLAIAQAIVQRHGGRIWVESAPGQGCGLHIVLPDTAA